MSFSIPSNPAKVATKYSVKNGTVVSVPDPNEVPF